MYMDNPIQEQKLDEYFPGFSVIKVNDRFYRIPNVVLEYIKYQEQTIDSLYEDQAGESL